MSKVQPHSLLTDFDIRLYQGGMHYQLYKKFGAHLIEKDGIKGVQFTVWAPNAKTVSVIGDFNAWQSDTHQLFVRWDSSGIWEGFIADVNLFDAYKYHIISHIENRLTVKADPYAFFCQNPPETASKIYHSTYEWQDQDWLKKRKTLNNHHKPMSIYEVHLDSWKKNHLPYRPLTYRELAVELVDYVKNMGYTHVELMPIMEYPYDPSWGYQIVGYFAPTSRFGTPDDFKFLINAFHQANIAVILDWVPSHFPEDGHGLGFFDGTALYEHPDKRRGYHPEWKSLIFDYGKHEVKSFLISNAIYWLQEFHLDGLRVDAVASMLHLNYAREEGEWEPNVFGGDGNLEAIAFLKDLNLAVYSMNEGVQIIAEESTSYPMVSKPIDHGGLGFGMKWMMGWMHDALDYFKVDPLFRKFHHSKMQFSIVYAFSENFVLPLSHDEMVYGKRSILGRMPGDEFQRFANVRALYSYMFAHPGSKLLFMGADIAQYNEWNFRSSVEWELTEFPNHKGIQNIVKDLNKLYTSEPALYEKQYDPDGFEWIDFQDWERSIIAFKRKGNHAKDNLSIICNFTPNVYEDYYIPFEKTGQILEIFNSDHKHYGGSHFINEKPIKINYDRKTKLRYALVKIPPLGVVVFKMK